GDDRLALGILLAQLVAHHAIGLVDHQLVTQQGREAQLAHKRLGELVEGVRQDHHLEAFAQPVYELDGAIERLEGSDDFLDVAQLQAVLVKDAQALLHQHVIVGNVPGGRLQRLDTGFFRKRDPDFRNQNTFQVETSDLHENPPKGEAEKGPHSSRSALAMQSAAL